MKRFFILVLGVALVACGILPLRLSLDNLNLTIPLVAYTNGNVIYPKNPSVFNQPPINISSVKLEGKANANNVLADVNVFLHARTTNPSLDSNCTVQADFILCPKAGQIKINSSALSLASTGSKRTFAFDDANGVLRDGVNAGKIWVGLEVASGAAANMGLQLSELLATVTIF
jgi:hypothetical protein